MQKLLAMGVLCSIGVLMAGCTSKNPSPTVLDGQQEADQAVVPADNQDSQGATDPDFKTQSASSPVVLATCLQDKGWKMYGTEWCGHCKKQKQKFGDEFAKIEYIDCDIEGEACTRAGIQGYPTRVSADGKLYPGSKELETLQNLSDC